jgi:GT2 family glycosyltransferase
MLEIDRAGFVARPPGAARRASRRSAVPAATARPTVRGKFLHAGEDKLWVKGVTYGTFGTGEDQGGYGPQDVADRDLAAIAANGFNAIRTYTVPPRWLLDSAERHGLRVMVGVPWEQHVAFLDDRERARSIERRVREGVRACAGHPAVLCYVIGNEIPAPIVRWHGRQRVERFLERLYRAAKAEDPGGLVSYVNYPTTEYLELPFLDFVCFNVYLETRDALEVYLARLQNLAGERPLVMAEIGFDSRRHGEEAQARALDWQIRTTFAAGCAGAFVFAWTDEWHRGGYEIDDWDFGLTARDRRPKPSLAAVREAFGDVPFPRQVRWPRVSVVVCSYNGARTIRDCFDGLLQIQYPDFEVIVVDDGSTDATAAIARQYGLRVISTRNHGLSSARNTGLAAATGEIVAYIDDDARPDPHWLTYLAATFLSTRHVGVGGPNIAPPGDGAIAECVANAPGGPIHVLLSDREAEHLPGCNMAFRRAALEAVGGFDPRFRTAGDDVDVCWRLQERGWTLGFCAAAVVWHHRRNSVRAYWKQQIGYGKAEALLEQKWPEKYNACGHVTWGGRLYGKGQTNPMGARRGRIYQGTWGLAPFQALHRAAPSVLASLPLMPEWYLLIAGLGLLSLVGLLWRPLTAAIPLLVAALATCGLQSALTSATVSFPEAEGRRRGLVKRRALTAALHLLQPLARLIGRLRHGLTPWRLRSGERVAVPRCATLTAWRETWCSPDETLRGIERALRARGAHVRRGGSYDAWDLEVQGGLLGGTRVHMAIEEHGAGRQLVRFRSRPRMSRAAIAVTVLFAALSILAASGGAVLAGACLGAVAALLCLRGLGECGGAESAVVQVLTDAGARRS